MTLIDRWALFSVVCKLHFSLTATDLKNEKEGKDTSNRRTARLFYVACTRAMESLAVVAYSDNPELVKNTALNNGWFSEDEIQIIETQSVL